MFRNLMDNLTRSQKIGILVIGQLVVILVLISIVVAFTGEREHVRIESTAGNNIPEDAKEYIADNIWTLVKSNVSDITRNDIDDVVIREGTYEETISDDGSVKASFIVDIDSIKQSYTINTGWSKDGSTVYEVIVDCPPLDQMKYPETVCYGAYNNTYSLDLYLPYIVESPYEDEAGASPDIYIDGDESNKEIEVMLTTCNTEENRRKADEYLSSIPVDLTGYTINYNVSGLNARCSNE